ncbi:MAG: hypothetical protein CVV62_02060, partial [Tenericutes bacterium HGW-Tenericutes-7]
LVGFYKLGSLAATDVFMDIEFTYADVNGQHGIIGRRTSETTSEPVIIDVWGYFVGQQVHLDAIDLASEFKLADLTGLNQAWRTTNLVSFTTNDLWTFDEVSNFYELA